MNARTAWADRKVVKDAPADEAEPSIMEMAEELKDLADKITQSPRPSLREAFNSIVGAGWGKL